MATDTEQPKKPSKLPTALWAAITAGLLWRTFFRPYRAVVAKGFPTSCPGPVGGGCVTAMIIQGSPGATPVYAVTSGFAAVSSDGTLSIASDREPVIVSYGSGAAQIFVKNGQKVGLGQELAVMSQVSFTVTELTVDSKNNIGMQPIDPSAWLAARGLKIAQSGNVVSDLWCTHGRNIAVPTATLGCGVKLPDPSALMLLPVTVTTQ